MDRIQDVRYGFRQLKNSPAFALTAIVSLGLGIGASVTMFSAFRAVFLRSLPYRNADRIVEIEKVGGNGYSPSNTIADLEFLRRYARSFESAAGYGFFEAVTLSGIPDPADLWVRTVSPELFPVLGTKPLLGRTFLASDFQSGAPESVVLAYAAWQKYFRGDPGIVGRAISLNEQSFTVVGVMPKDFYFPQTGIGAWLPDRAVVTDPRRSYTAIVARLRRGVSLEQASVELSRLTPALLATYAASERNFRLTLEEVATRDVEHYRAAFLLLLGATGFLILLSCLNVASLLLGRASARGSEFAVRSALGASRARLISQVLTESLVLAGLSGALGVVLAYLGNRILRGFLPPYLGIPRLEDTRIDGAALGFAVMLTCVVAVLFGLGPAFGLSAARLSEADRARRSSGRSTGAQGLVLIGEIAIALILFAGSILMIRGFVRLASVDPGFHTAHILTATVPPGHARRLSRELLTQRYREMLRIAKTVPGVEQAALTSYLPFGNIAVQLQVYLPGVSPNPYQIDFHAVSADYFAVMGIPLMQGRLFSRTDPKLDKGRVVINRTMANKYWPGQNAVGKHLSSRPPPSPPDVTVIGIVGDTQHRTLSGEPVPEFYQSYEQYLGPAVGTTLVLRAFGDPNSVASSLRQAIHRFDSEQVVENERTMKATVEQSIATPRFYTVLLAIFAALALVLTLVGVYGVASYGISLRTREFGIRVALGAERYQLIGMVMRQGFMTALAGIIVGAFGSWTLARLMSGLVYGISVKDPVSLSLAGSVLIAGALMAYYVPVRRSTRIDPAVVLRQE
ncbi:MAG: ABC transporter permease [Acidobacteriaceae bacterium]|nr:ABC transporter permease [Acidobacteriaceae bacterium]MBV9779365.1 ABC transporter permease [Acidobacteriaceae bacterium]